MAQSRREKLSAPACSDDELVAISLQLPCWLLKRANAECRRLGLRRRRWAELAFIAALGKEDSGEDLD